MPTYYPPTEYGDDIPSWVETHLLTRPNSASAIDITDLCNEPSMQLDEAQASSESMTTTARKAAESAVHPVDEPSVDSAGQVEPPKSPLQQQLPPGLAMFETRPLTQADLDIYALIANAREHPLLEAEAGLIETDEEMARRLTIEIGEETARRLAEEEKSAPRKGKTQKGENKKGKYQKRKAQQTQSEQPKTKRYKFQQPRPELDFATGTSQASTAANTSQQAPSNAHTPQAEASEVSNRPGHLSHEQVNHTPFLSKQRG
ncbi:hypothetical protein MMC30_006925 [Trapelia coarctata]|nr:hypothetical protein [Trapelia coarctata]